MSGFFSEIFDIYGVRERGRRYRAMLARQREQQRESEYLELRRREVEALEREET